VGGILLLSVAQGGAGAHLEDVERAVGPLEIGAQRFTVVLHKKRASRNADPDFGETLARLEIKNEAGAVQYQKTFPYEAVGNGFTETLDATVQVLQGKHGSGILITYGTLPSTPLGGESWQVFGPFSGPPSAPLNRRIVPFSKPISTEGQLRSSRVLGVGDRKSRFSPGSLSWEAVPPRREDSLRRQLDVPVAALSRRAPFRTRAERSARAGYCPGRGR
jgi:hypothetical protein